MGEIKHLKRKVITTVAIAGLAGGLIFSEEISDAFESVGPAENSYTQSGQSDPKKLAFRQALGDAVVGAMNGGQFDSNRFENYKRTTFLYKGSIIDATLTTLANEGIVSPTPQESASANCAMDIATFGPEQIPAAIRDAYNTGKFEAAAGLCLYQVIDYDAADKFGQSGNPEGIVYPVGLAK